MKVLLCCQQEFEKMQQNSVEGTKFFNPNKTLPISIENETEMWKEIGRLAEKQLSAYKTTLLVIKFIVFNNSARR